MNILVIGKSGFVSTSFQKYMKRYPDIIVNSISARDEKWKQVDFSGFDVIYNTTGLAHDDARMGTDEQFMALNRDLPIALAKKAKAEGVRLFINMSSMIVYGDMSELGLKEKITENTIPKPAGIYGESKLAGEIGLKELSNDQFHVALIRSPLVYSENAVDNFLKLTDYAVKYPVFPNIVNARKHDLFRNICELVKLIAENNGNGIYYPQQDEFICTSKLVKDVAEASGHKLFLIKIFNPILFLASKKMLFIRKVFGSLAYDQNTSNCFDGKYRVVDYKESINRLAKAKRK